MPTSMPWNGAKPISISAPSSAPTTEPSIQELEVPGESVAGLGAEHDAARARPRRARRMKRITPYWLYGERQQPILDVEGVAAALVAVRDQHPLIARAMDDLDLDLEVPQGDELLRSVALERRCSGQDPQLAVERLARPVGAAAGADRCRRRGGTRGSRAPTAPTPRRARSTMSGPLRREVHGLGRDRCRGRRAPTRRRRTARRGRGAPRASSRRGRSSGSRSTPSTAPDGCWPRRRVAAPRRSVKPSRSVGAVDTRPARGSSGTGRSRTGTGFGSRRGARPECHAARTRSSGPARRPRGSRTCRGGRACSTPSPIPAGSARAREARRSARGHG